MRKRNKVKQLHRTSSHRKAMLSNMVTSLLYHERITSTAPKAKAAAQLAEKLISKAKKGMKAENEAQKIHQIRNAARIVKDKEVLHKLFEDIATRVENRDGGYTRIIKVGRRNTDNSEMAIAELVDRKELAEIKEDRKAVREARSKTKGAGAAKETKAKSGTKKEK